MPKCSLYHGISKIKTSIYVTVRSIFCLYKTAYFTKLIIGKTLIRLGTSPEVGRGIDLPVSPPAGRTTAKRASVCWEGCTNTQPHPKVAGFLKRPSVGWAGCINSQPVTAVPRVWEMPRLQHVKDPFATACT